MILDDIQFKMKSFSRSQKKIAQFILQNPTTTAFLTAQQMAERVGVSEATVIRFADALGLKNFPSLKTALQETVEHRLLSTERLESHRASGKGANLVQNVITRDFGKASHPLNLLKDASIIGLARAICAAPALYLIGHRSAKALVEYLKAYLSWFFPQVTALSGDGLVEALALAPSKSLVIGISFPRYTQLTIDCLHLAHQRGFSTAAITDSPQSPLAAKAKYLLAVPCSHFAFIDSFAVPICALNALLLQVTECLGPTAQHRLEQLEAIWEESKIYYEPHR